MSKRFTDSEKWKHHWFRPLPLKAKLTWFYMCDECDHAGIWKPDFPLASFQLDFKITHEDIVSWFGDKVHFFDNKFLILPFFEFQYGNSKDSWSAKIKATNILQSYGFVIKNNKIAINETTVVPQCDHTGGSVLSRGIGIGIGIGKDKEQEEPEKFTLKPNDLVSLWNELKSPSLATVLRLSPDRESKVRARLKDYPEPDTWELVMAKINESRFLTGRVAPNDGRKKPWCADFDWLIKPGTVERVLEGKYDK